MPMGRGFSRNIGDIKSINLLSSGFMKVSSQTLDNSDLVGSWEFIVDPNSDWLVREAKFIPQGRSNSSNLITTSGFIEGGEIRLAKYGSYKSSVFNISLEVNEISKMEGENPLLKEVLTFLNDTLPPGTEIVDMRGEKTSTAPR